MTYVEKKLKRGKLFPGVEKVEILMLKVKKLGKKMLNMIFVMLNTVEKTDYTICKSS